MKRLVIVCAFCLVFLGGFLGSAGSAAGIADRYNVVWESQSKD